MKKLLTGLLALVSLSSFASVNCEDALQASLADNYTKMSQPYTAFYIEISEELKPLCLKNYSLDSIKKSCSQLCENDAEAFHKSINTKFRFNSKVKQLKSECKSLCDIADF